MMSNLKMVNRLLNQITGAPPNAPYTRFDNNSAQEGILLTESQIAALEKAKSQREAHGEIETHHPGYLGSQDTYFVGTMKGVGRIYQ